MIKKFTSSIFLQIIALGITVVTFLHEAFRMQFWKDDYALLYNLQQKEPFYFPYQHLVDLHAPLFSIFGTNPMGYFSIGILFLFVSSIIFYFLALKLFSNKMLAFMASLIFITTPVGIDSVLMMMTFATTYFMLSLFLTSLLFLIFFYEKRKFIFYLLSLFFLGLSTELVPYRSFYLVAIVMLFEFINLRIPVSSFVKKIFSIPVREFILRQLLLILVTGLIVYIIPVHLLPEGLRYNPDKNIESVFQGILNYKLLLYPILTTLNAVIGGIPYIFYQKFYIFNMGIAISLLITISSILFYFFLRFRNKDKSLTKVFLFSLGYLYLTSLVFYPYSSREIMLTTNRYLSSGMPAYSLFIICIYSFLSKFFEKNKKLKLVPISFFFTVLIINSITSQIYIKDFNTRSYYSTQFSTQMKKLVPNLPKNSLIYIKLDENANVNYRLFDTFRGGHYDERAYFAVLYNLKMEEVNPVISDIEKLSLIVKSDPLALNRIVSLQYDEKGLHSLKNINIYEK